MENQELKDIVNKFKSPTKEYRGKPFWSLNGKLEKEELVKQINVMKKMGFGGFFIHSRTGLQTEYLGEEWFSLVNDCIAEAKKLDMEVWLYDEDRWPSGSAGGLVTMNPRFRQKFICMDVLEKNDFDLVNYSQEYIMSFAAKFDGEILLDYYPITHKIEIKDGYKAIVYKVIEAPKDSFYNGYTYVDTLNREATEYYLRLTHQKYKEMCGEHFGKEVLGIFTDEPHRGALLSSFALYNKENETMMPYTYELFDVFKHNFGYDLKEVLPEIYFRKNNEKVSKYAWHYIECLQQLFLNNFAKPYYEWCNHNKLIVTGHVLHEDSLSIQTSLSGSVMRYYEYMDYPGVDVLTENNKNFWVVKQCVSVSRQLGKKFTLSELYGCTGWQFNFLSHKTVGDWQAALGINFRCHHLSWYTMEGEAKRDYPASILHQSTYWEDYGYVEDYFSRVSYVMSLGEPVCDVLVINPVESIWPLVHKGWMNVFDPQDNYVKEIDAKYCELFHTLTDLKIDFDYADEDILARYFRIELVDKKPVLFVGKANYEKVIVSGLLTIRSTTLSILKEFANLGGKVIFIGETPGFIDCEKTKIDDEKFVKIINDKKMILEECASEFKVSIKDKYNEEINECLCSVRKTDEDYFCLIVNTNRNKSYDNVKIIFNNNFSIEEWDIRNGDISGANFANGVDAAIISTRIFAGGERLYRLTKTVSSNKFVEPLMPKGRIILDRPMEYELIEDNVCVLDIASYRLNDNSFSEQNEILKIDREIRKTLGLPYRGGNMNQPWFDRKYNSTDDSGVLGKIELNFQFFVDVLPAKMELVIEKPESFEIYINEKKLKNESIGKWIDCCFDRIAIEIKDIKLGENIVILKADFVKEMNLEAIYLLGDFGVKIDGTKKTLNALPALLNIGEIADQGLPFFSGKIRYKTDIVNEKIKVILSDCYGALVKAISGEQQSIIAFCPFESEVIDAKESLVLELVLTRRNTFGPLHLGPVDSEWVTPNEFVAEGERFSLPYKLVESGIQKPPVIEIF